MYVCVSMCWCETIYGTTGKMKMKKMCCFFFLLIVLQKLKMPGNLPFLPPTLFLSFPTLFHSLSLVSVFPNRLYEILNFTLSPPRRLSDRRFIVQTRCDDNGSVSEAELGSCA